MKLEVLMSYVILHYEIVFPIVLKHNLFLNSTTYAPNIKKQNKLIILITK